MRCKSSHWIGSVLVVAALGMLLFTGCHTTAGFGRDLQSTGRDIQHSANEANR